MQLTETEFRIIGPIIHSVTKAFSERYFKTDANTPERSEAILKAIDARVALALMDAGFSVHKVTKEINAHPVIKAQMLLDGYRCPEDWSTEEE